MKRKPRKKSATKFQESPIVSKDEAKGWLCVGIDLSPSSIALAGFGYDGILKKTKGPEFVAWRWPSKTHYYDRITDCARAEEFIQTLQGKLISIMPLERIFIAIEEPFPVGMVKSLQSQALKQQAEISGALLAGLLRYGFTNIFQISNIMWRQIVAEELGITIHHTKWNYNANMFKFAPNGKGSGKWRAKEYGLKLGLPDWPDLINSTKGKIPRPETSKAKAVQPDDRYDAYAILAWMKRERFSIEEDGA